MGANVRFRGAGSSDRCNTSIKSFGEIEEYAALSQQVMQLTKTISESVEKVRGGSPSFVACPLVIFKLLGVVHGFRLKKLAAVTSAHGGLRGRGLRPRSQKVKRRPLSVVPDARAGGNIKKLPLISHKMAANRNDAFVVLAA